LTPWNASQQLDAITQIIDHQQETLLQTLQKAVDLLHKHNSDYYWVGIYFLSGEELKLGPFAGPPTEHQNIPVGRGICGTAVLEKRDQIIQDVSNEANYLACNIHTKAEAVLLLRNSQGDICAQLDIDGTLRGMFDDHQRNFLKNVACLLERLF
jgi:L-methionine (R)-S-oxide reductase